MRCKEQIRPSNSKSPGRSTSMAKKRPFDRLKLSSVAIPLIRPFMGIGALVWRYTVLLPLNEQKLSEAGFDSIADETDIDNFGSMLSQHFGGVTILQPLMGCGLRDPNDPTSLEL